MLFHIVLNALKRSTSSYQGKRALLSCLVRIPKRRCSISAVKEDDMRSLKLSDGHKSVRYHYLWLRDHCRCEACYNSVTSQRRLSITEIIQTIKPESVSVDDGILNVIWDDGHNSAYSISWLTENLYDNYKKRQHRDYKLWTRDDVVRYPIAHVNYVEIIESKESLRELLKSLVDYGVGFVENVPNTLEATEKVCKKLGPVQHTLFGGMWSFGDSMDHSDSAYTKEGLAAHTDNTYFTEAAGLQIFHCLGHDGFGGETILVDGFKAAELLRERHPDAYERLTTTCIPAEYIEEGHHYMCNAPILRLNSVTNRIEQIRFNVKDRAPLTLPPNQILDHYRDFGFLEKIVRDPSLEWKFKLRPGTVLIVDNFRVLHGRTKYTGQRRMCGCYIGRGDFLSKARVHNVLERNLNETFVDTEEQQHFWKHDPVVTV